MPGMARGSREGVTVGAGLAVHEHGGAQDVPEVLGEDEVHRLGELAHRGG
eukprot:CAMPEP_0206029718 /NCGR_PEP_ID=MMETSP1464-20131121/47074_1 /ASSEMBLY_ACC=CAM_ASM_001124 /TAXON_ID=119497 /ORGANISM="Exanthemachrysis gayraliae, Strain RCC1523" /LENGTH=49 /DNA_ID= /DNA_START= /DNA_END= /DNA_ORIENTATION=